MKQLQYINMDLLDKIPWASDTCQPTILGAAKISQKQFDLVNILKILFALHGSAKTVTELYTQSKLRGKRSFLNYCQFCTYHGFIKKSNKDGRTISCSLTDRGSILLGLFLEDHNRKP